MVTKPRPQWNVPITAGTSPSVHQYNLTAIITIDDDLRVKLGADRPGGPLLVLTPLEATQLGMALQDAGREAGQRAARRRR